LPSCPGSAWAGLFEALPPAVASPNITATCITIVYREAEPPGCVPAQSTGTRYVIQILADPRFAAPLLILLDFVIVYIILALAGYAVAVFSLRQIGQIILTVTAAVLLVPLFIEALRLRGVLRSAWDKDNESQIGK
jgi:hypothetical protein